MPSNKQPERLNALSHAGTLKRLSAAHKKIAKMDREMLKDGLRLVSNDREPTHYELLNEATGEWGDLPDGFDLDKYLEQRRKQRV